jgi:pyruvate/2-oxoglutarate dehydrogenase complex dihydrolipoamide dehydrogenase (E3) component
MSEPAEHAYDVIVIGAGPVGYTLATRVRPGKDERRWV